MSQKLKRGLKVELNKAIDYYNACRNNLGLEFAEEIFLSIKNILTYPKAWSSLSKNTRRCLIRRFPYGLVYQIKDDEIIIIACMQLNQKPGYWKDR